MGELAELEKNLGMQFSNYSLLNRALTHRSFLNENPGTVFEDNERLEFLGDAVLDFVVGAYLYHHFPEMAEGELTSLRAALVRAETLAAFAQKLEIDRFLKLGFGEDENGGRERVPILCATFEAVIGAIYLDQGLEMARTLTEALVGATIPGILASAAHKDAKSEFQVWAQAQYNVTPHYKVVRTAGPDHAKLFTIQVQVGDVVWGEGEGRSKQAAAQVAAQAALLKVEALDSAEV